MGKTVDITQIDHNFVVRTKVERDNLVYYDTESEPFKIYGVKKENGKFRRLREEIAAKVSEEHMRRCLRRFGKYSQLSRLLSCPDQNIILMAYVNGRDKG